MQAMRTFEVLGCGGFFFTQHTTAMEHMFVNHVHLVWSTSPEETVELYEYYRNRQDLIDQIRRKGQEFVYQQHTYKHRVMTIMKKLEEKLSK
ncbi:Spore protein YkvP [compost metagenome]